MNRIDEEEDNTDVATVITAVDQFPAVQTPPECSSNSIYPNKQSSNKTDRSKYQTTNRPTSLSPSRHTSSSLNEDVKQRRRYASDSNTTNNKTTSTNLLVTSFLQHLRNELKTTKIDKKHNYHRNKRQKSSERLNSSTTTKMNSKFSNENLLEINDHDEILTLIDLLVLRVECLSNENKTHKKKKKKHEETYPTVTEVDQNLIEYLYYLFTKFTNDDSEPSNDLSTPIIDKNNFVNVCQTLVRNGCFDLSSVSTSSEQSFSETTSNSSDQTLVREYHPDTGEIVAEISSTDGQNSEQETWLVVDLEPIQSEEPIVASDTICQLPNSTSDEQLLINNDNYKSSGSESSHSIYLSPNESLIDIQNMVQELDELNEDGSSMNVMTDSKIKISNDLLNDDIQSSYNICTRLINDDSLIETSEQMTTNNTDKMSRREKKMQERWSISTNNEQSPTKTLLGVEFPQIAVLRRKFSSSNKTNKTDTNPTTPAEEINTSLTTIIVNNTNPDQIFELPPTDASLLISTDVDNNNDDGQLPVTTTEFICLSDEEMMMRKKQEPLLTPIECHIETITNINNDLVDNQKTNNENCSAMITNPSDSNSLSSPCSPLISISPSSLILTTNENKTIEPLPQENEEEEKEEEQRCDDDYNVDEKKKNNSSFVHDYHASRIILINDEPTQTALLQQEKKEKEEREKEERERPSSPLPTLEQFNHQRTEDESSIQTPSKDLNKMAMITTDENEERYKKVEIEEIPDDEETLLTQNIDLIEPTDYIHTDDEPKKPTSSSSQPNLTTNTDEPIKFNHVLSCYEKAFAKVVDSYDESTSSQPSNTLSKEPSTTSQQSAEDPIALRALQRFEERMNAAAAKTNKEEINSLATKGKSSWSGSLSTPRKSIENLFKSTEQQLRPTPQPISEQSATVPSASQSDSYIRARKTFDDNGLNYGTTINLLGTINTTIDKTNNDDHKPEEQQQQQPSAIVESDDKRVNENKPMTTIDLKDQQQQHLVNDITMISGNEIESLSLPSPISTNSSLNTVMSQSLTSEQSGTTPYRFQFEGRRRLNTLERLRERQQSRESLDTIDHQQQQQQEQLKKEYTLKPEEVQDPIIRRALERFDEKSRSLAQTKSMNYDDVQDPITRRALMRLESNLKRTIPPTSNDSNETWYTENYTLGSLQPTNDRVSRYPDSSQSPRTKYISVHQRYCTPSSNDISDLPPPSNEHEIPVMRVPAQPIYVTSNNQQPLSLRQRSRSEDMLASRDLTIGQTTNLDDIDTSSPPPTSSALQRNRSSNEIALNEPGFLLPNTLIKTLDPNFVRTTESTVSYVTPTQTYSAYSCEYTRPRRNPLLTSAASETPTAIKQESNQSIAPKYSQQQQNEIQRPTPYRPPLEPQPPSTYVPIQSSAATTTTSNYYPQQPLPTPSYGTMYTSNNLNQTPYSEDPIVRRALDRFNSHLQNSLLTSSQYQPANNYSSQQGTFQDSYVNSNRPSLMTTSTSSNGSLSGGYQSIIGRRRYTARPDDPNHFVMDNTSVGDGYTSSIFTNAQNPYQTTNHYMNMSDEPPAIPPRFRRETYDINEPYRRHSTDEYLSENINNNNNNNSNHTFIHHAYPATITNSTGFRPIIHYNQLSQEQDDFLDRAQSSSSNNSSDSTKLQRPVRPNHIHTQQRLPATSVRTNKLSPENPQSPSEQTTPNNGDSVFHRLAYTGTKASLSKSSSNSCSNLLNKNAPQIPSSTQLQSCEIDFDESNMDNNNDITNKYLRSKSVDARTKLKLAENNMSMHDEQDKSIPSSKFTSMNNRRDVPPPRVPLTPTTTHRTTTTKRSANGNNISYTKNSYGIRTHGSNGNIFDTENDENLIFNDDNYQPKIIDHRMRTSIPVQRYTTNNNNIQPSPSTSSINSTLSRTKQSGTTMMNLERRDSNASVTDLNRTSNNRLVSPSGQRRNIPVSVFAPAKLDNKRPAPAPPSFNYESQSPTSYSPRDNENEMNTKSARKASTGNLRNDLSQTTDKHDHNKKMNVFERLFRGNKKKN